MMDINSKISQKQNTYLNLRKYACSWSLFRFIGNIVGIPGMNIFSCSLPPQRDLFFFFEHSSPITKIVIVKSKTYTFSFDPLWWI